jgi:hypothetical protein
MCNGGESGIRTHGGLAPTPVFKTGALNHSTISPVSLAEQTAGWTLPSLGQPLKVGLPIDKKDRPGWT